ncbi:Uncharacterised protein [Corynebacterium pilosum]|uniref:Uncharacterized protein n=1 Tax=Corynebacterium pilosum TaxID=35756 RepID=A0A376CJR0_9CORY|nr:Uncharacterised protein [Corynebacterium pilosum]
MRHIQDIFSFVVVPGGRATPINLWFEPHLGASFAAGRWPKSPYKYYQILKVLHIALSWELSAKLVKIFSAVCP